MRRGWLIAGLLWGLSGLAPAIAQTQPVPDTPPPGMAVATFATGCFWCTEADFDKVKGVVSTTSGYLNGKVKNPATSRCPPAVRGMSRLCVSSMIPPPSPTSACCMSSGARMIR